MSNQQSYKQGYLFGLGLCHIEAEVELIELLSELKTENKKENRDQSEVEYIERKILEKEFEVETIKRMVEQECQPH